MRVLLVLVLAVGLCAADRCYRECARKKGRVRLDSQEVSAQFYSLFQQWIIAIGYLWENQGYTVIHKHRIIILIPQRDTFLSI